MSVNVDIEDVDDVEQFVNEFYTRVRADEVLGFIFDEVAQLNWAEHLPLMYEFWETVLFNRPIYKGNPLLVHLQLNELMQTEHGVALKPEDFARWVALFHETLDELFAGPRAEQAKRSAARVAQHLVAMLEAPQGPLGIVPHSVDDR